MKRETRFRMPHQVTTRDGSYWSAVIDGELVQAPFTGAGYTDLVNRIKAGRAARVKARLEKK